MALRIGKAWGNALGGYKIQNRRGGKFASGFAGVSVSAGKSKRVSKGKRRYQEHKKSERRRKAKKVAKVAGTAVVVGASIYGANKLYEKKAGGTPATRNRARRVSAIREAGLEIPAPKFKHSFKSLKDVDSVRNVGRADTFPAGSSRLYGLDKERVKLLRPWMDANDKVFDGLPRSNFYTRRRMSNGEKVYRGIPLEPNKSHKASSTSRGNRFSGKKVVAAIAGVSAANTAASEAQRTRQVFEEEKRREEQKKAPAKKAPAKKAPSQSTIVVAPSSQANEDRLYDVSNRSHVRNVGMRKGSHRKRTFSDPIHGTPRESHYDGPADEFFFNEVNTSSAARDRRSDLASIVSYPEGKQKRRSRMRSVALEAGDTRRTPGTSRSRRGAGGGGRIITTKGPNVKPVVIYGKNGLTRTPVNQDLSWMHAAEAMGPDLRQIRAPHQAPSKPSPIHPVGNVNPKTMITRTHSGNMTAAERAQAGGIERAVLTGRPITEAQYSAYDSLSKSVKARRKRQQQFGDLGSMPPKNMRGKAKAASLEGDGDLKNAIDHFDRILSRENMGNIKDGSPTAEFEAIGMQADEYTPSPVYRRQEQADAVSELISRGYRQVVIPEVEIKPRKQAVRRRKKK